MEKGLTAAFGDDCALEATLNQIDPIEAEEEQSGEGGSSRDAEAEDEDKDEYDYQDNSTIDERWYKLQCNDVFASSLRPLHNHTTWIDL